MSAGIQRRNARIVGGTAALLIIVTACSIPSRPVWWPKPKHTSAPAASTDRAGKIEVVTVAHPWHQGARQLGIQVYWTANKSDSSAAVVLAKSQRIINYAISLNANSIAVTFPFYTHGITASRVFADRAATPSPAHIGIFLAAAARSDIRVTLRPILNEDALVAQNPLAWRGSISPASRGAWFRSYRNFLLPFARIAQTGGAATFVVGTELDSVEQDPRWPGLIRSIKRVYHGQLVYDENYNEFAAHDSALPLAAFGVDAYPRFSLPDGVTVARLARAWDRWLGTHSRGVRRRTVLSEVGIDAVAGSFSDPGAWMNTTSSPINVRVQAKWYEAVCRAIKTEQIGGVFWWEVSFDADPAAPAKFQSDRLTFLGRPAQRVIRNCFAGLSSTTIGSS